MLDEEPVFIIPYNICRTRKYWCYMEEFSFQIWFIQQVDVSRHEHYKIIKKCNYLYELNNLLKNNKMFGIRRYFLLHFVIKKIFIKSWKFYSHFNWDSNLFLEIMLCNQFIFRCLWLKCIRECLVTRSFSRDPS